MNDILDEVLKDHSDERKVHYFKKAVPIVVICSIVVILCMTIYERYDSELTKNRTTDGDALISSTLQNQKNDISVIKDLETIINRYATRVQELALLDIASIKLKNGDKSGAKSALESIIGKQNILPITASIARISWIGIVLDQDLLQESERKKLMDYFGYFTDQKQPLFGFGTLLKAHWYAKNNQPDLAIEQIDKITSTHKQQDMLFVQAVALREALN